MTGAAGIAETDGKYRARFGVLLDVTDADGKNLNFRKLRELGTLPASVDTRAEWAKCKVKYSQKTRKVYWIGTDDGKTIAEIPQPAEAPATEPVQAPKPTAESVGPFDGSSIPPEMKACNQWLCWKYEVRDGKETKVPINPKTYRPTDATKASWTYDECVAAIPAGHADGIGFSLRDGFVGVDFDKVLGDDGQLKPEYAYLKEIIDALKSYTEWSPSRRGLHIYFRADIPPECRAGKHTKTGEIYSERRFFTVTGRIWEYSPAQSINTITADEYRKIYSVIGGEPEPTLPSVKEAPKALTIKGRGNSPTDEEVMLYVLKTEKGRKLWGGDTSGYPSGSEADMALLTMLAAATKGDQAQIKRLFMKSGLGSRKKVTEREDYLARSIANACKFVAEEKQAARGALRNFVKPVKDAKAVGRANAVAVSSPAEAIAAGVHKAYNWETEAAQQACEELRSNLPDTIRDASSRKTSMYVIIDPFDRLTKTVSSGSEPHWRRWCNSLYPDIGYYPKFTEAVFDQMANLHAIGPIPPIDIYKGITALPCKDGYISLKDGKKCEPPAEMEYCPFMLNLTVEEAEYDPDYQPTGKALDDLMTYLGAASVGYLLSATAASIPRIPANRRVSILTGLPRSSKSTFGAILGELGLAPPASVDFSSEIDGKEKFKPQIAENISDYPMLFINDPPDPDVNAVKKFCDITQQYERKHQNQTSVFQRATVTLTLNRPEKFTTSGMNSKVFFIHSKRSYNEHEIDFDTYMKRIREDGSLRDIWQEIIRIGLEHDWEQVIPEECKMHNKQMQNSTASLQKWLTECRQAPPEKKYFKTLAEVYANYMVCTNPDTDPERIRKTLEEKNDKGTWCPKPQIDGFDGKSKSDLKRELMAMGYTEVRPHIARGFYIHLPRAPDEWGKSKEEEDAAIESVEHLTPSLAREVLRALL